MAIVRGYASDGGVCAEPGEQAGKDRVARIEHADGRRPAAGVIRGRSSMRHDSRITPRRVFDAPRLHPGYAPANVSQRDTAMPGPHAHAAANPKTGAREFG